MKLHRLVAILLLLETKGMVKAKDMAERFEVSVRTIYRDIDTLCEAGIPVTTTTGPNGGFNLMDGWSVGIKDLHSDDVVNLYLSAIGIQPSRQSEMSVKINNALLKLKKGLSDEQQHNLSNAFNRFYFDEKPWWGEEEGFEEFDNIVNCIFADKKIQIKYSKFNDEESIRKVHPYGIVVKARVHWYLVAYCENSKGIRTFKCDRITECIILDEEFIRPNDFIVEEYWKESNKRFKSWCNKEEEYIVKLKIHQDRPNLLKGLDVIGTEYGDSNKIVTINMHSYTYAIKDIRNITEYVEVIEPIELRDQVIDKIKCILGRYKK